MFVLEMFINLIKLDVKLRRKIRKIYILGKRTQRSIHGIKNDSIWIYIHRGIKQRRKKKKIVCEERENDKISRN